LKIIVGPPGTGKTTRLLNILEEELKRTDPSKVAFCSFTRKAVGEAVDRAMDRFSFTSGDLSHFKTLHSLGFSILGLKRSEVMQNRDYKRIGEHLGLKFSNKYDSADSVPGGKNPGDKYQFIEGYSKARCLDPSVVWDQVDHDNLNWFEFVRYRNTIIEYKRRYNKVDYSDMLSMCDRPIDVDVVIIDEAQDLSSLQWQFVKTVFANAKRMYIAGDDDQAIFQWSGADVNHFVDLTGDVEVLTQSHRIPKVVHDFAKGITDKIQYRKHKTYKPMNREGVLEYFAAADHVDISSGTWLLLARNSYFLNELASVVKDKGHIFSVRGESVINKEHLKAIQLWEFQRKGGTLSEDDKGLVVPFIREKVWTKSKIWHESFTGMESDDKEYYISLLRRGESLTKTPRINISTIHGVKGGEAQHVLLLTDMALATWEGQRINADSEHRVWYVGATRCLESLSIIMPRGRYHYDT
jgi:DNA helicase-2/ATP-dependent DNA helicase PcrA